MGVNAHNLAYGNPGVTAGRDLPWLQDVDANGDGSSDTWESWGITERDVVILDKDNVQVATYNLTVNDLSLPANYQELRDLLVEVASSQVTKSSLSGYVYFDVDNDGVRDAGESPLGNVPITLTGTDSEGVAVNLTKVTDTDGSYAFLALDPGSYTIAQAAPDFVLDGKDTAGSQGGTVQNDRIVVQLAAGVQGTENNFGELGRRPDGIQLTDFLASRPTNAMLVAAASEPARQWYSLEGSWSEYPHAELTVTPGTTLVDVKLRNSHGHVLNASFLPQDAPRAIVLARAPTMPLMRLSGPLTDLTAAVSTAASAVTDAEGERVSSDNTWSLVVEEITLPVAPTVAAVRDDDYAQAVDTLWEAAEIVPLLDERLIPGA